MATTFHLGDCMQACNKCMDNYHEQFIGGVCPTCYTEVTSKGEINADTYALLTADLPRGE